MIVQRIANKIRRIIQKKDILSLSRLTICNFIFVTHNWYGKPNTCAMKLTNTAEIDINIHLKTKSHSKFHSQRRINEINIFNETFSSFYNILLTFQRMNRFLAIIVPLTSYMTLHWKFLLKLYRYVDYVFDVVTEKILQLCNFYIWYYFTLVWRARQLLFCNKTLARIIPNLYGTYFVENRWPNCCKSLISS